MRAGIDRGALRRAWGYRGSMMLTVAVVRAPRLPPLPGLLNDTVNDLVASAPSSRISGIVNVLLN